MNIILRLFGHRIDVMADDKKAADKAPVAEKAKPVGLSITSMLMQTALTFVACFAACFLTFQIVPKAINVEQIIKQVEKPETDANLPVYSLGEFVVNLADPGGTRFLKTAITIKAYSAVPEEEGEHKEEKKAEGGGHGGAAEGADPEMAAVEHDLAKSMPAIKDLVISTLSTKTADELASYETKLALKEEMVEEMNKLLHGKYRVFDLYFTDFIIQ